MEFDGNFPRKRADALALTDVLTRKESDGVTLPGQDRGAKILDKPFT